MPNTFNIGRQQIFIDLNIKSSKNLYNTIKNSTWTWHNMCNNYMLQDLLIP